MAKAIPSRRKVASFMLGTFLLALPAMVLLYRAAA
jgi:hypothetical protein